MAGDVNNQIMGKTGDSEKLPVLRGDTAAVDNKDLVRAAEVVAKLTGKKPKEVTILDAVAQLMKRNPPPTPK